MAAILTATSTDMKNNFGKYLRVVMDGNQIIVTKNGKKVARFIPEDQAISYLTDSLTGILKESFDVNTEKDSILKEKYETAD